MSNHAVSKVHGVVVENEVHFTLIELSRACLADVGRLVMLVDEGVLVPIGDEPESWRFAGAQLRRARLALRLERELELQVAGVAMVLELLDQIDALKSQLRRAGLHQRGA